MKSNSVATRRMWINRNAMTLLTAAIVAAYAAFIQWAWGWGSVLALWLAVGLGTALAALSALLSTYVLRAWRIYDYFPAETAGRFATLLRLTQVHNLLNVMLPFRSGEASFPLLMMREFDVSLARATAALLVMRLFDLHALLAAAGIAMAIGAGTVWMWIAWGAFLALPLLGFALRGAGMRLAARSLPDRAARLLAEIEAGLPADTAGFFRAWGATLLNWFTKIAVLGWVVSLLGGLGILPGLGGALGGELSSVLPFHAPAGVGTYPAGISVGAVAFGASATGPMAANLAQAAVNAHLLVIVSALVGTTLSLIAAGVRRSR